MPITITLDDDLAAGLENLATKRRLSIEQVAITILTEAAEDSESVTPEEVVAKIRATPPNLSQIRPATGDLAQALRASPADPSFDLESWNRQWAIVETEMKAKAK